jgi:prevent-host-death family protein
MPERVVGAFEAKTHLSRLLDDVANGETVYITKYGEKVAKLVPVNREKKKAVRGCAKGSGFYMSPDFDEPLDDFKDYM